MMKRRAHYGWGGLLAFAALGVSLGGPPFSERDGARHASDDVAPLAVALSLERSRTGSGDRARAAHSGDAAARSRGRAEASAARIHERLAERARPPAPTRQRNSDREEATPTDALPGPSAPHASVRRHAGGEIVLRVHPSQATGSIVFGDATGTAFAERRVPAHPGAPARAFDIVLTLPPRDAAVWIAQRATNGRLSSWRGIEFPRTSKEGGS